MVNERFMKLVKICERAERDYPTMSKLLGNRASRLIDLQTADEIFNLRLDEFLNADEENFCHDVFGIWKESDRSTFPCTFGLFVPRFAEAKGD